MDPRQVLGAFLTLSMFAMLGNMIKKDHFDSVEAQLPEVSGGVQFKVMKVKETDVNMLSRASNGPWKESSGYLKPCWTRPTKEAAERSKGYITFSLTGGPEYHVSQVADAAAIARYLGATLVLPDIRGSELGQKRNFEDIYNVDKFMRSLDGIIKIARVLPAEIASGKPAVVRVPNRVTEDYIAKNIEPIFRMKRNLRLAIFFPLIDLKVRRKQRNELVSVGCLAMFDALELKPEIHEVANMMVERLRALSHKSNGQFIAVDLRVDILEKKGCKESGTPRKRSCYGAQEVAIFLQKIGFDKDTTVYLTQTWWHESLNFLKESFPKTYTKDDVLPSDKKGEFLKSGNAELEKVLDFFICSESDVFVPAISGMFYGNVAGKRIASGRNQILVPSEVTGPIASPADFISSYVSKKNHMAYSCYC